VSYGFELRDTTGTKVQMSTDNFGLMVADVFDISPGTSGSRFYPELAWHNNVYAQGVSNISGSIYSRTLTSHAFVNITISVNASNQPTIHWAPHNSITTCIGGDSNDTTAWTENNYSSHKYSGFCKGGDRRPDIRIIVLVG